MKNTKKQIKVYRWDAILFIFLGVIVSLVCANLFLDKYFVKSYDESLIIIEDTATKNKTSFGTDVRIESIKIDGENIPFDNFEQKNGIWTLEDGLLIAINPSTPTVLEYKVKGAESIEILFQKHEGSGIVKVYENDKELGTLDLYSQTWDKIVFKKSLGYFSVRNNIYLFLTLLCSISLLLYLCVKNIAVIKKEVYARWLLLEVIIVYGFVVLGSIYYDTKSTFLLLVFLVIAVGFELTITICELAPKRDSIVIRILMATVVLMMSAAIAFLLAERINGNSSSIALKYVLGNIVIYSILYFGVILLVGRLSITVSLVTGIILVFAIANYYVTSFRGSPIVPGDFLSIGTAMSVVGNYRFIVTWNIFSSVLLAIYWCLLVRTIYIQIQKLKRSDILHWSLPLVLATGSVVSMKFFEPTLDLWNLNNNIRTYGIAMSLVSNIRSTQVVEPEGYSYEELEELSREYCKKENMENDFFPNFIVIMNESLSDLSVVGSTLDNNVYLPFYNSLQENVIKGYALASTIGGGTSNTEYEFLTGNSMAFIPGMVPYQQVIKPDTYSVVGLLKNRGYKTVAIHPYDKRGYSRYKVYPELGFDEFFDIDDFISPELERNRYITDKESYEKVIELFRQNQNSKDKKPIFIFNVTMQNHSDYTTGYFGNDVVSVPGYEGEFSDVEEYLTLIKKSDEAIEVLIDFFQQVEEPTIVMMFGDHQPKVENDFYETMEGKPLSEWSLEETQKRYEVPFFIWANYDIQEDGNLYTSINYLSSIMFQKAGVARVPYQEFLLSLSDTIPRMNINGYLGDDNQWHYYSQQNEYREILDTYWKIQYNNIFARKKCEDWFVDIKE